MEKTKLKQLVLVAFRGASNSATIDFDPEKKVTMIFGDNGTGKSSIVDGFSFLCEGKLGFIEDRSGAESKHVTSICGKPEELRVKLTTSKGTWEAAFKPKSVTIVVKPAQGCPDVRILRRSSILRLIEAAPNKRFEALQDYINVPGIIRSESALRDAVRETNEELTRQTQAFTDAQSTLTKLWEGEGKPGVSAEEWAKTEKAKDLTALRSDCESVERLATHFRDLERAKVAWDKAKQQVAAAETAFNRAIAEQNVEEQKVIGQSASLLALLKQAKDYVTGTKPLDACPVCQKPADAEKLAAELQTRIASMSTLSKATSTTDTQKKALDSAKEKLVTAEEDFLRLLAEVAGLLKESKLAPVVAAQIPPATLDTLHDTTTTAAAARLNAAPTLLDALPALKTALDKHKEQAQKSINQQNAISTQLELLSTKDAEQKATNKLLARLRRALEIVAESRKAFVTAVLTDISQEVERLYNALHPKENIGKIRLSLDPRYIGSLNLHGDFHTAKDVPPQSLFSESHLDTLGLCVFLALAKKYKTDDTIIILDDVLTSVDRGHLDRFIELLHDEEEQFNQIIVTTHYQPWRDRYRNHRAPGGKVHFIELRPWALDTGIRVQGMKLCLDELRQALAATPFDRQVVASKAGIFLENMLEFLARVFACKLPLTSQTGYTLRELTDCFGNKLLKLLKTERITVQKVANSQDQTTMSPVPLEPIISQIKGLAAVRNQVGCHYNYEASNVPDGEVEELGKLTITLGEALVCSEGGDLPSRNRSGSYHESKSGKVRLHPFEQPD